MSLDTQLNLGPGHTVLDGDPASPHGKGHSSSTPLSRFADASKPASVPYKPRTMSILAKRLDGSRYQWYGGRPRPRRRCVRWGPSSTHGKGHSSLIRFPPYFYFRLGRRRYQASFIAVFATSCTRYRVSRPLGSRLSSNDARRRYFQFCRNRK